MREISLLNAAAEDDAGAPSPADSSAARLLAPQCGTPGIYRVIARGDGLALDLGFRIYRPLDDAEAAGLKDGAFVRLDGRGAITRADDATKADLFTYPARVLRVVDGDTLLVEVTLMPQCVVEQKLRLRGIDCPEMDCDAGKAAKRFTATAIAAAAKVIIHTTKPDKYDRYLADVFAAAPDAAEPGFLNNALLTAGHAVRKDTFTPADWDGFFT